MLSRSFPLLVLAVLSVFAPVRAERLALAPPATEVAIRVYGLGMLPLDGVFTRFHGWFDSDAAQPGRCEVLFEADTASLDLSPELIREEIAGPEFLDAARYPVLAYRGACQGDRVEGDLTLHGQTHKFALTLAHEDGLLVASGNLRRTQWGMAARLWLGGETVRIRVSTPDPWAPVRKASRP